MLKKNLGVKSIQTHEQIHETTKNRGFLVISRVRPGIPQMCCPRIQSFLRLSKINVLVDLFAQANLDTPVLVALIDGVIMGSK